MFSFTKQERTVLSLLLLVVLSGTVLRYVFTKYPTLADTIRLIENGRMYPQVDINTASVEALIDIPYIGEYTANNIIRYREEHGPFSQLEEIKNVKGIKDKNYERFYKYLIIPK